MVYVIVTIIFMIHTIVMNFKSFLQVQLRKRTCLTFNITDESASFLWYVTLEVVLG